jgi:small-conductance mechanosensitive channel
VILDALATVEGVEKDPAPDGLPWELGASSVDIKVRWWTDSRRSNVVLVRSRVVAALKTALSEAGIDLPFPTQTVLLHDQTEEATAIAPASARAGPPPRRCVPQTTRTTRSRNAARRGRPRAARTDAAPAAKHRRA